MSYKLKLEILSKTKELKGTNIFISIDYTVEEYQKRKVLLHHLKIAKGNNYLAIIKNNVLFVDGEAYTYEDLKNNSQQKSSTISEAIKANNQQQSEIQASSSSPQPQGNKEAKSFAFIDAINPKKRKITDPVDNAVKRLTRQNNKK